MTTAADILVKAGIQLNDEDAVRWTFSELAGWINAAQRAIVLAKPDANSRSVVLTLQAGTLQTLPTFSDEAPYLALLRILRNITAVGPPRVAGRAIRSTTRDVLDAAEPNWHVSTTVPFNAVVRQYTFDEAVPREFYVYPGNTGTGMIEAAVSVLPADIVVADPEAPDEIASWGQVLELPTLYDDVILDHVLFRALSRDDLDGNRGRAISHFNAFASAIGIKMQSEARSSPNTRAGVTQA